MIIGQAFCALREKGRAFSLLAEVVDCAGVAWIHPRLYAVARFAHFENQMLSSKSFVIKGFDQINQSTKVAIQSTSLAIQSTSLAIQSTSLAI